jgi:outer membrane protein OmpA-like peptidoglycan-associated protein
VGEEALRALAAKRADQVRSYLVGKGQLPENRVLLAASAAEAPPVKARASRVDFSLQ